MHNAVKRTYGNQKRGAHRQLGRIAGWHLHYAMGVSWTLLYSQLIKTGTIKNKVSTSILIGALTGIAAVAGWKLILDHSDSPPNTDKNKFYGQLIPAHILFALIAISALRAPPKPDDD